MIEETHEEYAIDDSSTGRTYIGTFVYNQEEGTIKLKDYIVMYTKDLMNCNNAESYCQSAKRILKNNIHQQKVDEEITIRGLDKLILHKLKAE